MRGVLLFCNVDSEQQQAASVADVPRSKQDQKLRIGWGLFATGAAIKHSIGPARSQRALGVGGGTVNDVGWTVEAGRASALRAGISAESGRRSLMKTRSGRLSWKD